MHYKYSTVNGQALRVAEWKETARRACKYSQHVIFHVRWKERSLSQSWKCPSFIRWSLLETTFTARRNIMGSRKTFFSNTPRFAFVELVNQFVMTVRRLSNADGAMYQANYRLITRNLSVGDRRRERIKACYDNS
jgi:hypothetical protein